MEEQALRKIESGRQVGKKFSFVKNGETYWAAVALQKHDEKYKVYFYDIMEKDMAAENYWTEYKLLFSTLDEALLFISSNINVDTNDLRPLTGSKIFDPNTIMST